MISRNLISTSILNCLDKNLLALSLLPFLLFSCKNEGDTIGFAKEARLQTYFVDLPLKGSTVQQIGVITRNNYTDNSLSRLLIGGARNSEFGGVEAIAITNFGPPYSSVSPTSAATLDSLVLQLNLDQYHYGASTASTQKIQVFGVLDTLSYSKDYYSISRVPIGNELLGETTFVVDPYDMDNKALLNSDGDEANNDSLWVRIVFNKNNPKNDPIGKSLLNDLVNNVTDVVEDFDVFKGKYKGFAIVMPDADKIVGINPKFSSTGIKTRESKLSLYYKEAGKQTRVDFVLAYQTGYYGVADVTNFSQLKWDRDGTELSGIEELEDFKAPSKKLYVQSGTALITKVDLSDFYKYVDTIPNLIFNSAQLIVKNLASGISPPSYVRLSLLNDNNQFRTLKIDTLINGVTLSIQDPFLSRLATTLSSNSSGTKIDVVGDLAIDVGVNKNSYVVGDILITQFCQLIYQNSNHPRKISYIALMPSDKEFGRSFNGLILDQNIFLRFYYSKPIVGK